MKPNAPNAERQSVQILLVEDDPDDVWVMRNLLGDRWDGSFKLIHVELLSAGLERLFGRSWTSSVLARPASERY